MHYVLGLESLDQQVGTMLVGLLRRHIVLAMSGRECQNGVEQDGALLDENRNDEREQAGAICAVEPFAQMLCVVVDERRLMTCE